MILTLVITKSWYFTVLTEAHDKLEHQGDHQNLPSCQTSVLLEGHE